MNIEVKAVCTSDGWVLVTADAAQDTLAGPVSTELEILDLAVELELDVIKEVIPKSTKSKKIISVGTLQAGVLFHSGDYWYRMIKHTGKKCTVDVVGENRQDNIPADTPVTEISVLSLK